MTLLDRLYEGANSNDPGNALCHEAAERIGRLEDALKALVDKTPTYFLGEIETINTNGMVRGTQKFPAFIAAHAKAKATVGGEERNG